jgi:hypothetical protein
MGEQHQTYKVGTRRKTRQVNIGGIKVGGDAPISVMLLVLLRKLKRQQMPESILFG